MSVLTSASRPVFGDGVPHQVAKAMAALRTAVAGFRERRAAAAEANEILSLCSRYEELTPNLAAELRFIASRS